MAEPGKPLHITVREARHADLPAITEIHNQGIEDRAATLDLQPRTQAVADGWWSAHGGRYAVIVACDGETVIGWASLNRYSPRPVYDGVADLSVYVRRDRRGGGVGRALMAAIERSARENGFHKIVLFAFPFNAAGQSLYRSSGFREVGTFRRQGRIDGRFVDVVAMEKVFDKRS